MTVELGVVCPQWLSAEASRAQISSLVSAPPDNYYKYIKAVDIA